MSTTRKASGFTIIEVMIVLVIAGLILLIILIAVPSLQRNARNTTRKEDAAGLSAALANFINNNGRLLPDSLKSDNGDATIVDIASSTNLNNYETSARMGYYNHSLGAQNSWGDNADNIFIDQTVPVAALVTPVVAPANAGGLNYAKLSTENVGIVVGETCNDTGNGPGILNQQAIAVFYVVENGDTDGNLACITQ